MPKQPGICKDYELSRSLFLIAVQIVDAHIAIGLQGGETQTYRGFPQLVGTILGGKGFIGCECSVGYVVEFFTCEVLEAVAPGLTAGILEHVALQELAPELDAACRRAYDVNTASVQRLPEAGKHNVLRAAAVCCDGFYQFYGVAAALNGAVAGNKQHQCGKSRSYESVHINSQ